MNERVEALFDDFAARFARGERPDPHTYLARAGGQADELARLLDAYLVLVPPGEPSADDRARVRLLALEAMEEGTLLGLRKRGGLSRGAVVDAIVTAFSLDEGKREKVRRYYHELESGQLDPKRVNGKLWLVLGKLLGAPGERLAGLAGPQVVAASALYRRDPDTDAIEPPMTAAAPDEPDEVDRLFLSGP